jgi:hypothetical protein
VVVIMAAVDGTADMAEVIMDIKTLDWLAG